MGKMALGLDDRSARLIHGRDVWTEIKDLLTGYSNISAAIAYVGTDADQFIALRGPATILVNAGDHALANGFTDPEVLLRWTRRGVRVYSLSSLHAKVILADGNPSFVLVGSADVLSVSGRALDEALLVADERETVDEMRDTIAGWKQLAGEPLTEAWLQAAVARYRSPVPYRLSASSRAVERSSRPAPVAAPAPAGAPEPAATPAPEPTPPPEPAAAPVAVAAPVAAPPPVAAEPTPPVVADPAAPAVEVTVSTADEAAPDEVAPDEVAPDPEPDPAIPVEWPRPKYIYLATLTQDGRASDSALEQLEALRAEFRAPAGGRAGPTLEVQMFWQDEAARSAGRPAPSYREGWHIVPISVPASGRPAVLSAVDSPGRVLRTFTEYGGGPARTYYYLLEHVAGPSTTYRRLREALTAVGEKPSYDHAYMMQHKVAAILDLWPQITYSD